MNISEPFIRRPIATALAMSGLAMVGLVAYLLLPVAPLPQVEFPTIQVTAQLPGTSPETMASSVASPLERQLAQMPGVAQLTSVSGIGITVISIQFDLARNIDAAGQDVQAAINAAGGQLPKNLPSPPTYRKTNPSDPPVMVLAMTSDTLPLTTVSDLADNIFAQHRLCRDLGISHWEWLVNLEELLDEKEFQFFGVPLKFKGGSGSPVRAFAVLND